MLDLAHAPKIDSNQVNDSSRTVSYSTGQQWTSVEEGCLQAIIARADLPKRTTIAHWTVVADHLSKAGQHLGLPLRSPASCWRKASRMGLIASSPQEAHVIERAQATQASFAPVEIRNLVADAFERACAAIVRELRGA